MNHSLPRSIIGISSLHDVALMLAVAAVYYFTARLGLVLAFDQTNASPVWPPSGIAFAALILLGRRVLPGIFIGALLANLVVFAVGSHLPLVNIVYVSVQIAFGNTLEAMTGVLLLNRLNRIVARPKNMRGMVMFILSAILMCLVGSIIGSLGLFTSGAATSENILTAWFTWWLGDLAGILVITPLILSWAEKKPSEENNTWLASFLIISLILIFAAVCVFWEWLLADYVTSMPYLLMPLLMAAVYRCGAKGGSTAVFIVALFAVIGTIGELGPFANTSVNASLLLLQVFICVMATVTLLLAAAIEERDVMELALLHSNEDLEERIAERTAELARSNRALSDYRKNLEKKVEQRTQQLESSNRELEAFSYSVSHDLRTPLRSIDGFTHALEEELAGQLNTNSKEYLQRVRKAAQRMGSLIDDLIDMSRVSLMNIHIERIDLSVMAAELMRELSSNYKLTNLEFECAEGIIVEADTKLIHLVMLNLLDNALKYSARKEITRIEVGQRSIGNQDVVFVKDNGVGFNVKFMEKLFKPFQRLHGAEFEGTGIGLATVSRIIERHAGKIWAESVMGAGTTFYFTIGRQ